MVRTIKAMQFYPVDHPRVTENISECTDLVQAFLADHPKCIIGVDNDRLLIQEAPVEDKQASEQLIEAFEERKIGSVVIKRGVSEQEFSSFLELLTTQPDNLLSDDQIKEEYLEPLLQIQIDELEVQYSTSQDQQAPIDSMKDSGEDESEEDDSDSDTGEEDGEEDSPFSSIESKTEALRNLLSSDPDPEIIYEWITELAAELDLENEPDPAKAGIESIMQLISSAVEDAEEEGEKIPNEPAKQFLVQFMIKLGLGDNTSFDDIKSQLTSSVDELDSGARDLLMDQAQPDDDPADFLFENVQPRARGLVLAREIRKGTASMDQISHMMESVAPGGDDVVEVTASAVEEMSQFTNMSGKESSASELASLFNALLSNTPYQNPSHQILIADNDEKYDQYLIYLSNLNYFFDLHEDGYEAWRAINADQDIDLIILEIKIPGKTGLELIEDLTTLENPPPVIVCTKYPQFRDAYEIVTYPTIEFLEKPVQEEEFAAAVERLFPSSDTSKEDAASIYSDEEMLRARDIQEKLISQQLPEVDGYDVSRFHHTAPHIDGDYTDVIPINDDEYLFTMAEVSGNGVSASLVMVIIRSTLHVLLKQMSDPREMLIQLNRFITNDINRSMYATILLGRLNTSDNTMELASAGKSSPIFWNQKSGNVSRINLTGISAGLTGDRRFNEYLEPRNVALNQGDGIILHSKGVPEAENEQGNPFGEDRLQEAIQRYASTSAEKLISQLDQEIASFRGDAPVVSDASVLAMKSS
jgi:serine phosphatase RsbU (regulator of sigma subunit)